MSRLGFRSAICITIAALFGTAAVAAMPTPTSAFESKPDAAVTGAAFKIAMGSVSSPQVRTVPTPPDKTVTPCMQSAEGCSKPYSHPKHRHAGSNVRMR
jgi:hypothetical protein